MSQDPSGPANFIRDIIASDTEQKKYGGRVITRFPPEPNGYLHIGHAKSICLNFGMAQEFGGACNLRFDDTNPVTEDVEYVQSIMDDIRWLGFSWDDRLYYASDYFQKLYDWAIVLIKKGAAYVESLSTDEIREYRGDYYRPGKNSPYRERSVEENLKLFEQMKNGEIADGEMVLRAKIDMASPNINFRDPLMYRIKRGAHHHRTGTTWNIYPMYDYAHGQCDAIEKITHSICTLEFEDHRPLYEWFLKALEIPQPPQQIEFAKLKFTFTVLSKRRLLELVREKHVQGWDDPRMPTLRGLRRRGYTPEAIRRCAERVGVAKRDGVVDISLLEHTLREHLNETSPRVMVVLRPLKVVIENIPEGTVEWFDAPYHPENNSWGSRKLPLSREIYVERDDFRLDPPKKWFRLAPGAEVRLRYACLLRCTDVIKDQSGEVTELRCTWDPNSRGGNSPDGRKVRGTLHWVDSKHAAVSEVRMYDRLFSVEHPSEGDKSGGDYRQHINPKSLEVLFPCYAEPSLAQATPESRFQFERVGYFCVDNVDSKASRPVFNLTISLKDSWEKQERRLTDGV